MATTTPSSAECEALWSEWSECSSLCLEGSQSRSLPDDSRAETVCGRPAGTDEYRECEGHPMCGPIVGGVVAAAVVIIVVVVVIVFVRRYQTQVKRVKTTAMGRRCVRGICFWQAPTAAQRVHQGASACFKPSHHVRTPKATLVVHMFLTLRLHRVQQVPTRHQQRCSRSGATVAACGLSSAPFP